MLKDLFTCNGTSATQIN